jgi:hypothetical protein
MIKLPPSSNFFREKGTFLKDKVTKWLPQPSSSMEKGIFLPQQKGTKAFGFVKIESSSYHWKTIKTKMSKVSSHSPFENMN